ncbi:hypothetical protein ACERIT_06605 [Halopenitus sp. H-Gu1]|uniref:hypothetical protein n=1 Tax=Halopenitus sp. H-Gu1 TaxID=3242697 RepID=UPI00359CD036
MVTTLEQYGTGGGIPIGAGIGGTAAMITGLQSEFAVLAGFGAAGGLVVGGFAGRFTDGNLNHDNWQYRVLAYTLFVSLTVGVFLGILTAWMVDGSYTIGAVAGSATGGVFGIFMSGILISASRKERTSESTASTR